MDVSLTAQLRQARAAAERAEQSRKTAVERAHVYEEREKAAAARALEAQTRAERLAERLAEHLAEVGREHEPLQAEIARLTAQLEQTQSERDAAAATAARAAEIEARLDAAQESLHEAESERAALAAQLEDIKTRLHAAEQTAAEAQAAQQQSADALAQHEAAYDERRKELNRVRRQAEKAESDLAKAQAELASQRDRGALSFLRRR